MRRGSYLLTFPIILGAGKKLFGASIPPTVFKLAATRTTSKGVIIGTYRFTGRPTYGQVHSP